MFGIYVSLYMWHIGDDPNSLPKNFSSHSASNLLQFQTVDTFQFSFHEYRENDSLNLLTSLLTEV